MSHRADAVAVMPGGWFGRGVVRGGRGEGRGGRGRTLGVVGCSIGSQIRLLNYLYHLVTGDRYSLSAYRNFVFVSWLMA